MNEAATVITAVGGALIGLAAGAIPLYMKLQKFRREQAEVDLALRAKGVEVDDKSRVSVEGGWKRILEEREKAEAKLRENEAHQDQKYELLLGRFIEGEKERSALIERTKSLESRVDILTKLMLERCPECPSLRTLIVPPSVKSSPSLLLPTVTPDEPPSHPII